MFKGDSADTWAEIFSLVSMGGRAEGLACVVSNLAHCQKLGKFTVMSQPTILKLKVSNTGHGSITFRNFYAVLSNQSLH